jgi:hypothetical protein
VSKQLVDQRRAISERLAALRAKKTELSRKREDVKGALASVEPEGIAAMRDSDAYKTATQLLKEGHEVDQEIEALSEQEKTILGLLGQQGGEGDSLNPNLGEVGMGWDGHRLLGASDAYRAARDQGVFHSDAHFGTLTLGKVAPRESAMTFLRGLGGSPVQAGPLPAAPAGPITTFPGGVVPDYRGIIPPFLQPLTLLDLIPSGTTDSNIINYVQITAIPLGAVETAELDLKPELGLTTVDATAPVRTIAGYVKLSRQSLDDIAGLGTFINTQIPYAVRYRLLQEVLAGDGTGQNLLGIYNTTGVGAPPYVANDNIADGVMRAATVVALSGAEPNFVAMHPIDYQNLVLTKDSMGRYIYGSPGQLPSGVAPQTLWGLAVTRSWAVPQGSPLVGDSNGATLLVREGINVKTSDSDQDDFVRNRVTVLGEMRVAFPVWRPSAFAIAAIYAS